MSNSTMYTWISIGKGNRIAVPAMTNVPAPRTAHTPLRSIIAGNTGN